MNVLEIKVLKVVIHLSQILRCISQLELAQLIGTSVKTKYIPTHKRDKSNGGTAHPIEAFDPEGMWSFLS